jgi:DNA-binding CsgD family transcriptional regulator
VAAGDLPRAGAVLDRVLHTDTPMRTIAHRPCWCARAELALADGDPATVLQITDRLMAATPGGADTTSSPVPRIALLRGQALLASGARSEAEPTLLAAHAGAVRLEFRTQQWRIELALGRLYRSGRQHRSADEWLERGRASICALAANLPDGVLHDRFQQRIDELLPSRRRSTTQPRPGSIASASLTRRECEIATLIGQGLSNPRIAARLVLHKRTVETHVGNMLAKLGFSSRAQLIHWAITRGLTAPAQNLRANHDESRPVTARE